MKTIHVTIVIAVIVVGAVGAGYIIAKNTQSIPEAQEKTTGWTGTWRNGPGCRSRREYWEKVLG